jgi:TonB-dependent starch-binding outer membrane protein SusC
MQSTFCIHGFFSRRILTKTLLFMNFTAILLLAACLQVSAGGYSQKVTLSEKNAPLTKVLNSIKKQTGYSFFFDEDWLQQAGTVTIKVKEEILERALDICFKDKPLSYSIVGNIIVVKLKEQKLEETRSETSPLPPIEVRGTITDESKNVMQGVSVTIKGTKLGTASDANGNFTIQLPEQGGTLVISYIGYESIETKVSKSSTLNFALKRKESVTTDIVVVGYGTRRKIDVTGAVSSVNSGTIIEKTSPDALGALQSRIPGLSITNNSGNTGNYRINIRGFNSINASNKPLFVIDGIIGADYTAINPVDIERIDVLKDASSSAIYGARGSGGVIIITTKQGNYGRKPSLSFSSVAGFNSLLREIPVLNSTQYQAMEKQAYANSGVPYPDFGVLEPTLFNPDNTPKYNTNWQRETYRPTTSTNTNLSVAGGNDSLKYSMAIGYQDDRPLMILTHNKKYSGRINIDSKVSSWLRVGLNLSGVYNSKKGNVDDETGYGWTERMALEMLPYLPVKHENGNWSVGDDHKLGYPSQNPVNDATSQFNIHNRTIATGSTYLNVIFSPSLDFKTSFSGQLNTDKQDFANSAFFVQRNIFSAISASQFVNKQVYWQSSSYFTYKKTFNLIHSLNAVAGVEWSKLGVQTLGASASGFDGSYYLYNNLAAAQVSNPATSSAYSTSTNSFFGRVEYALHNKYLITATGRYDGASVFGANNKFGFFPSAAIGWRVSEEAFLKNSRLVSNLKLRASYGSTGNSAISPYQSVSTLATNFAIFSGTRASGVVHGVLPNPDLKWEQTNQTDIGIDLGLFNNRVEIVADVYNKVTDNLLLNAPVPLSSGYASVLKNVGSVGNKGIELAITTQNLIGAVKWSTSLIYARNRNKVLQLGVNNEDIFPGPAILDQISILRVGQQVGSFWGYLQDGTWSTADATKAASYGKNPGDVKVKDLNGDGKINASDQTIIGHAYPSFTGGIINRVSYKEFDLTLDIGFSKGGQIFNIGSLIQEQRQTYNQAWTSVMDAWTPTHQNTSVGYVRLNTDPHGSTLIQTDRYVMKADYIRGRNLVLGYNLPARYASKIQCSSFRFFVGLQNFFMATPLKYSYNPEGSVYGQPFAQGIDLYSQPIPRIINVGLNLNLK